MIQAFDLLPSDVFAAQGRANQIHHQTHGQQAIKNKGDDGPQNAALGTECFGQGHEQSDVKPRNDDQVHFFELCNLGDINMTDTVIG